MSRSLGRFKDSSLFSLILFRAQDFEGGKQFEILFFLISKAFLFF
jgi:hypothetical protein